MNSDDLTNQLSSRSKSTASLVVALKRLDTILSIALQAMEAQLGAETVQNPHRGLYIAPEDVARLLSQTPGTSLLWSNAAAPIPTNPLSTRLATLQTRFSLTTFDLDILLIALAPLVDSRYDRIYAYLQDDVTKKQPSVDLALNLLCQSFETKLAARDRIAPHSPLIHHQLIQLVEPHPQSSLLNQFLTVDERMVGFLLGQNTPDAHLHNWVHIAREPELLDIPSQKSLHQTIQSVLRSPESPTNPPLLYLLGPDPSTKLETATAACAAADLSLLVIQTETLIRQQDIHLALSLLHREATLQNALLFWNNAEALTSVDQSSLLHHHFKTGIISNQPSFISLASQVPNLPFQGTTIPLQFPAPSFEL